MSNFASSPSVQLKRVRLTWADIYTIGKPMDGGKAKFKISALFAPNSEAASVASGAMIASARLLWGANAENMIRSMAANSKAIRQGNDKMDDKGNVREEYKDMLYISAANESRPQIVGPKRIEQNGKMVFVDIAEDGRAYANGLLLDPPPYKIVVPYRGCYVNLKVQFVAGKSFTTPDKKILPNQVYAKLEAIQFVEDGIAFGAGPTSAEGFGDEEVETTGATAYAASLF